MNLCSLIMDKSLVLLAFDVGRAGEALAHTGAWLPARYRQLVGQSQGGPPFLPARNAPTTNIFLVRTTLCLACAACSLISLVGHHVALVRVYVKKGRERRQMCHVMVRGMHETRGNSTRTRHYAQMTLNLHIIKYIDIGTACQLRSTASPVLWPHNAARRREINGYPCHQHLRRLHSKA